MREADREELERMAAHLDASDLYRVHRRIQEQPVLHARDGTPTYRGAILDVETTGLDFRNDEIIELAILPFDFSADGRIFEVGEPFNRMRKPARALSREIVEITGITDAMLEGQAIHPDEVAAFVDQAELVVAHNAAFDRRFAESFCNAFAIKRWGCSLGEVPWAAEGFEGSRLVQLATGHRLFFEGHRALHDCRATLEVLSRRLPICGRRGLDVLFESVLKPRWQVWAQGAPFELKDALKSRGYRWSPGDDGRPKAWHTEVTDDALAVEKAFLCAEIYGRHVDIQARELTAFERYSERS